MTLPFHEPLAPDPVKIRLYLIFRHLTLFLVLRRTCNTDIAPIPPTYKTRLAVSLFYFLLIPALFETPPWQKRHSV